MTVTEYIHKKNDILFRHLGEILVPEDQIEECDDQFLLSYINDASTSPYCVNLEAETGCRSCPMHDNDNFCADDHSTYNKVREKAAEIGYRDGERSYKMGNITRQGAPWETELRGLIEQYNKELSYARYN